MNNILFAFDLHNTLINSNTAWIEAYLNVMQKNNDINLRIQIEKLIYMKKGRNKISDLFCLNHDDVIKSYLEYRKEVTEIKYFLDFLVKINIKPFLISSGKREIVLNDIKIDLSKYFEADRIYCSDNFSKKEEKDWLTLMRMYKVKKIIYIGNDIDEDFIEIPGLISLLRTNFLTYKRCILND